MDANSSQDYQQSTRPDFVFYKEDNPCMILDTKFKPGWLLMAQGGKIGDLLPDWDKCISDMVSINADADSVIFPTKEKIISKGSCFEKNEDGNSFFEYVHSISKFNSRLKFIHSPFSPPSVEDDFESCRKSFINSCKHTFEKINDVIKSYS